MFMTRPSSRACLATVGLTAALATAVRAQDQPSPPVFEVAAIKPHNPSDAGGGFRFQHGRLTISNTELKVLVMSAYGVNQFQISGGPNWMDSERFAILAQAPGGSDHRHLSPMLQALLADRFKLALHRETRETTVYALALAKNGPKLQRSAPDAQYSIEMGPAGMSATKMSIHNFVDTLSGYTRRRVIDKTGLEGDFDWKFDWSPQDPNSPSIFTALQEQLGLKLEAEKGPVEFLIIDHVEKPSEN
jgi:uncharacterized protein (TIGR03435 family)